MTTDTTSTATRVHDWLLGRLPDDWFTAIDVTVDKEEVVITGTIPAPDEGGPQAEAGRIQRFREDTRGARIEVARELEAQSGRKVAWAVRCGTSTEAFTRLAVPVMTRLAQPERRVLDTLVEAGVARSRSEALSWCVRLVRQHEGDWLAELDQAMTAVRVARAHGPAA
jgi:hypothetical protein